MLTVYNPKTRTFGPWGVPQSDLPVSEVLLLNILIELQLMNTMLKEENVNQLDSIESMRTDIVGN